VPRSPAPPTGRLGFLANFADVYVRGGRGSGGMGIETRGYVWGAELAWFRCWRSRPACQRGGSTGTISSVEWLALIPIVAAVVGLANLVRLWWTGSPRPVLEASWEEDDGGPWRPPAEGVVLELYGRHKDVELHQVGVRRCAKRRHWWRRSAHCPSGHMVSVSDAPKTLKAEHSVRHGWHLDHLLDELGSGGHWHAWAHVGRREIWARIRGERRLAAWWRRQRQKRRARRLMKST
jgi:hypothetical protein